MPSRTIRGAGFSADIVTFLRLLSAHRVRYLVVGGEAVIFHGYPRVTGDIDFFYENSPENAARLFDVLYEFWEGQIPGIQAPEELLELNVIIQFGRPPHRIDLMNRIDGVRFRQAWASRIDERLETTSSERVSMHYIDLKRLVRNKRATNRHKDLEDARFLNKKIASKRKRKPKGA